jgi:hypothetical protein
MSFFPKNFGNLVINVRKAVFVQLHDMKWVANTEVMAVSVPRGATQSLQTGPNRDETRTPLELVIKRLLKRKQIVNVTIFQIGRLTLSTVVTRQRTEKHVLTIANSSAYYPPKFGHKYYIFIRNFIIS